MQVLSSRVICHTDDLASLRGFYEDVLGLRIYREYGQGGRVTGVVYFLGGGFLEVAAATSPSPPLTLWLQVPDASAEATRLDAAGVEIIQGARRMPWGLIELWARDPQGNELRIVEVPRDHPLRRRVG
ncbi:MAG: VOC family protein [Actinomycetota bacterium]|nr:VOC family protein [Actinomycetota bacterium]